MIFLFSFALFLVLKTWEKDGVCEGKTPFLSRRLRKVIFFQSS